MARDVLTGSRIRERRITIGLRQAELARQAGISASYLNLIEHNRRRIGGKLLNQIAAVLGVEVAALSEGAGTALLASLHDAAAARPEAAAEIDRADEFAGRFPGWARLLADSRDRIATLDRAVDRLSDRLTHDPHLATALHEMLSTVTAIRSAATILSDPEGLDADWQARFLRNLNEDSTRLADTARTLAAYLETDGSAADEAGSPQEETDAAWQAAGHRIDALEAGAPLEPVLDTMSDGLSGAARSMLNVQLTRYAKDAAAVPMDRLTDAVAAHGLDTVALSAALGVAPQVVMRRLAAAPAEAIGTRTGLIVCDASGMPLFRKPLAELPMPRLGAGCPLWPLYRALNRPFVVLTGALRLAGSDGAPIRAEAVAMPMGAPVADRDPVFEATMLLRPLAEAAGPVEEVGSACRVCLRAACAARREPSILKQA